MYFRKHTKLQGLEEPRELDENEKLETEEGRKKAQSLFSKKFMEYLSSKKSHANADAMVHGEPTHHKDQATSSDETSASESSRKTHKKFTKKIKNTFQPPLLAAHHTWRTKLTQCNFINEPQEVVVSDELKPFLMNMSILLQELKQAWNDLPESETVYSLLSKITVLVTEFSRRPIRNMDTEKKTECFLALEKTMASILNLINEHKNNSSLDFDNELRQLKKLQRDLATKEQQIEETQKYLMVEERERKLDLAASDLHVRVTNSTLFNERLKARIKFNQTRIKRYKKILVEKEWTKHKLGNDLALIKKKISKIDLADDGETRETDTTPGLQFQSSNEPQRHSLHGQTSQKPEEGKLKRLKNTVQLQ